MASKKKRAADTYLTHDNWDAEEESEEQEVLRISLILYLFSNFKIKDTEKKAI